MSQVSTLASSGSGAISQGPAKSVGGQRSVVKRRPASHASTAGKPSRNPNQGILKFYTDDAPGLKVGPTTVLVLALVYMFVVVLLHILGKFRQTVNLEAAK